MKNTTLKQFKENRDKLYTVVSFKDGIRTLTYGSLNSFQALAHIMNKQLQGEVCLIFAEGQIPETFVDYDIKAYDVFMGC